MKLEDEERLVRLHEIIGRELEKLRDGKEVPLLPVYVEQLFSATRRIRQARPCAWPAQCERFGCQGGCYR